MLDFDQWMARLRRTPKVEDAPAKPMLPNGVMEYDNQPGRYFARCERCECEYELPCSLEEWKPEGNVCNGSQWCTL